MITIGKRAWIVRTTALASAVTAFCFSGFMMKALGPALSMPGELRSFHSPLRERCDACHLAEADSVHSLTHGMTSTALGMAQSKKCLECHELGDDPLLSHGWSEKGGGGTKAHECATCHHEHQGRRTPLSDLSTTQCRSCHAEPFSDFASGHPEFESLPNRSPSRLHFSHATHLLDHFPEAGLAADVASCSGCHAPDDSGTRMLLRSFDESCASCHADEIRGARQIDGKGLTLLSLPALDVLTLEEREHPVGSWPADAAFCETPLSPFLELFLSVDDEAARDLKRLREIDVLDLIEASDEDIVVVARVAWRVKRLLAEIRSHGHDALCRRIESAIGRPLDVDEMAALIGGLSSGVIERAVRTWLPALESELAALDAAGDANAMRNVGTFAESELDPDPDRDSAAETWVSGGGWYVQDLDPAIRYRPSGHADPLLCAWFSSPTARVAEAAPGRSALDHIRSELSDRTAIGECMKCHRAAPKPDEDASASMWNCEPGWSGPLGVTRFEHSTHFPMLGEAGCATCHELDETSRSNEFGQIEKSVCVECHVEDAASTSCLTCHDYHARPLSNRHRDASLTELLLEANDVSPTASGR